MSSTITKDPVTLADISTFTAYLVVLLPPPPNLCFLFLQLIPFHLLKAVCLLRTKDGTLCLPGIGFCYLVNGEKLEQDTYLQVFVVLLRCVSVIGSGLPLMHV